MSEEAFQQEYEGLFTGPDDGPCELCGWPDAFAQCVQIVEEPVYTFPACPDCGRPTDSTGHTIAGRDLHGRAHLTVIIPYPRVEDDATSDAPS